MSVFFVVNDDGTRPTDNEVREWIRFAANRRIHRCPIRLFDRFTRTVVTRGELAEQLFEAVVKHASTPPTPMDDVSSRYESDEDMVVDNVNGERGSIPPMWLGGITPKWEDLKAGHDHEIGAAGRVFYFGRYIDNLVDSYSRYAILSHRWSKNELLFSDIPSLDDMETRKPEGYKKFTGFARVVKDRDPSCRYLWIDTLCINKDSSAELDESILTMFNWYRNSHFCIVHLAQTKSSEGLANDPWFKRGWTLQELLASPRIKFYASDWSEMFPSLDVDIDRKPFPGSDIKESIAHAAGIDSQYIKGAFYPTPDLAPLVFSWAARRQTTRPEDIAYCLVGLLKVHLPIAYGEGEESAFARLQIACIQSSPSRGLFWWDRNHGYSRSSSVNSLLALRPSSFTSPTCDIRCDTVAGFKNMDSSFTLTNAGLRIEMWLLPIRSPKLIDENFQGSLDVDSASALWTPHDLENIQKGRLVVGVLGFDSKDQMYAVVLSKASGYWIRHGWVTHMRLPSKSDLKRSQIKPQRILIK